MRSEIRPEAGATGQLEASRSGLCITVATPWGVACLGDKGQGREVWLTAEDSGLDLDGVTHGLQWCLGTRLPLASALPGSFSGLPSPCRVVKEVKACLCCGHYRDIKYQVVKGCSKPWRRSVRPHLPGAHRVQPCRLRSSGGGKTGPVLPSVLQMRRPSLGEVKYLAHSHRAAPKGTGPQRHPSPSPRG